MAIMHVALDVPDDVYRALLTGELVRRGGVVRDAAGQIVTHLKDLGQIDEEAANAVADEARALVKQNKDLFDQNQVLAKQAAELAKQNKMILVGVGVVTVAAAIGGTVFHTIKSRKDERPTISEAQSSFNKAMATYLDSVRAGDLNEDALDDVLNNLVAVKEGVQNGSLTLDFSDGQLDMLVSILKDYTERLAKANNMVLSDEPASVDSGVPENVVLLMHYLSEQKLIMKAA